MEDVAHLRWLEGSSWSAGGVAGAETHQLCGRRGWQDQSSCWQGAEALHYERVPCFALPASSRNRRTWPQASVSITTMQQYGSAERQALKSQLLTPVTPASQSAFSTAERPDRSALTCASKQGEADYQSGLQGWCGACQSSRRRATCTAAALPSHLLPSTHLRHLPRLLGSQPLQVAPRQRDHPPALVPQQGIHTVPPGDAGGACGRRWWGRHSSGGWVTAKGGLLWRRQRRRCWGQQPCPGPYPRLLLLQLGELQATWQMREPTRDERHALVAPASLGRHDPRRSAGRSCSSRQLNAGLRLHENGGGPLMLAPGCLPTAPSC